MQWDIGLQGLGVLILMSLGFGVIAQLVAGRATTRWLWMIAGAAYFVGGLFISEVWFGWATEVDLQPNIDGLSFDEVLLIGLVPGILSVLLTWYVTRRRRGHSVPEGESAEPKIGAGPIRR
jgi:MFS family permease